MHTAVHLARKIIQKQLLVLIFGLVPLMISQDECAAQSWTLGALLAICTPAWLGWRLRARFDRLGARQWCRHLYRSAVLKWFLVACLMSVVWQIKSWNLPSVLLGYLANWLVYILYFFRKKRIFTIYCKYKKYFIYY